MRRLIIAVVLSFVFCDVFPQNIIDPASIEIVRDRWGVPHIFAQTDAEVAYGLAWAHAEDDFETIQKCFLASKSMLGQLTGRAGAGIDYVVHLLRLRELVEAHYETDISPSYKAVLQGYCDGLNAYAYSNPKEVLIKKSFPVTPKDLLAYCSLQLAIGCGVEAALKKVFHGAISMAAWEAGGSNGFAFNSKKTKDGNVYFAINTHHPLEGQVAWYEAHLSSEEGWNILGALFPGSPVIFTGVNEHLGWTHTVNHPDKLDVYQLEMHPENNLQYKVDDVWLTLEETTIKLKVKVPGFNLLVKRKAYWSIYGPTLITDKGVFSIRNVGTLDIRALEQWHRMNKARNFFEFKTALSMGALPGYNIVYADRYDTIYYLSNGKLPVRHPDFNWKGTLPGNTSQTLWTKFHSVENLPQVLNPPSGYVFNTNHSPFMATAAEDNINAENFDATMGYETHDNNRSIRARELIAKYERLSFEDFKRIKYDLQLPQKLAYPVNIDTVFLLDENEYPEIADLITKLKTWDRKGTTDSNGAAIFAIFFYYVADKYQHENSLTLMTKEMCAKGLRYVKDYCNKYFGNPDLSLGEYQRLERGDLSVPLPGLPDVLAAMYSVPAENGRVKGSIGDGYISLVKFTSGGPEIETVNCYGASNRRGSAHYDDQMELFINQKTKKMSINREEVYREAKSVYHPGILPPPVDNLARSRR